VTVVCPKCHAQLTGLTAEGETCKDCLREPATHCHKCGWNAADDGRLPQIPPQITYKDEVRGMRLGTWTPGNGMRYTVAAIPFAGSLGTLGETNGIGWLVVSGNTGRAHLLQSLGFLAPSYVAEKFELRFDSDDLIYVTRLIGKVIDRETP
jgi:hypothetical protein